MSRMKRWPEKTEFVRRVHNFKEKKIGYSWPQTKTAKLLKVSKQAVSLYIKLSECLKNHPELREIGNERTAELKCNEMEQSIIKNPTDFKSEEELRQYLINIWENIKIVQEWNLIESEYDTGDGSRIDLLAKHKGRKQLIVIELKLLKTDDKAIGQLMRYIGWVKLHKCNADEEVKGLIISNQINKNLLYAIQCVDCIDLMLYEKKGNIFKLYAKEETLEYLYFKLDQADGQEDKFALLKHLGRQKEGKKYSTFKR